MNKKFFVILILGLVALSGFFVTKNIFLEKNSTESFVKEKSEFLVADGKAYLYKIKDKEKDIEKFWFVATNAKLENTDLDKDKFEKVSENIFWDPEHCAQMFTLTVGDNLYFFESRF